MWAALEQRWDQGWDHLDDADRQTIAPYWLEAEAVNGSLDAYFSNSSGDLAPIALAGLERLGLKGTHEALKSAMAVFGPVYPTSQADRLAVLSALDAESDPDDRFVVETTYVTDFHERALWAALEALLRDPDKRV